MVSLGFHSGFHLMVHLNFFRFRISLELHLGFHWRVSFKVSLGLGFRQNVTNYKGFLIGISYHDFHSSCGFFYMRLLQLFFTCFPRVSFRVSSGFVITFSKSSCGFPLGFNLGILQGFMSGFLSGFLFRIFIRSCGFLQGFFKLSLRVRCSSSVPFGGSLGFHLGFIQGFIQAFLACRLGFFQDVIFNFTQSSFRVSLVVSLG